MSPVSNLMKFAKNVVRTKSMLVQEQISGALPSVQKNKWIEVKKEKAESASKSEAARRLRVAKEYWKLEMAPPVPTGCEIERMKKDMELAKEFIKCGCYKFVTVKQAWLLFLVCLEIYLWFYLGETIGKMHVVGYVV